MDPEEERRRSFFTHEYRPCESPGPLPSVSRGWVADWVKTLPPVPVAPPVPPPVAPPVLNETWYRRARVLNRIRRTRQLCRRRQEKFRFRLAAARGRLAAVRDRNKAYQKFLSRTCYLCGDTTSGLVMPVAPSCTLRNVCDDCMDEMAGRISPFQASCRHAGHGHAHAVDWAESGTSFDDIVKAGEDATASP